jgi:hypothetical protein
MKLPILFIIIFLGLIAPTFVSAIPIAQGGSGFVEMNDFISFGGSEGVFHGQAQIDGFNDGAAFFFGIYPQGVGSTADRWLDLEDPDTGFLTDTHLKQKYNFSTLDLIVSFDYENLLYKESGDVARIEGITVRYIEMNFSGTVWETGEAFSENIIAEFKKVDEPSLFATLVLLFIYTFILLARGYLKNRSRHMLENITYTGDRNYRQTVDPDRALYSIPSTKARR